MILGEHYRYDLNAAVFIRSMRAGTFALRDLREKYAFIADNDFAALIQRLAFQNVILFDKALNTVTFTENMEMVVLFLERTKFVERFRDFAITNYTGQVHPEINKFLIATKFYERLAAKGPRGTFNLSDEVVLSLEANFNEDYRAEVNALNLWFKVNRGKSDAV